MKPKDLNRINESEFKKGELMRKEGDIYCYLNTIKKAIKR